MELHFSLFILRIQTGSLLLEKSPISTKNYIKYLTEKTTEGGRVSGMKMEGSHLKPRLFLLFFRLKKD